jgi:hypothetical protein
MFLYLTFISAISGIWPCKAKSATQRKHTSWQCAWRLSQPKTQHKGAIHMSEPYMKQKSSNCVRCAERALMDHVAGPTKAMFILVSDEHKNRLTLVHTYLLTSCLLLACYETSSPSVRLVVPPPSQLRHLIACHPPAMSHYLCQLPPAHPLGLLKWHQSLLYLPQC